MNLDLALVSKYFKDKKDKEVIKSQAGSVPELMNFLEVYLLDRLSQMDKVNADDANWVIKRAMQDGRQAEVSLLYEILFKEK